MKHLLKRLWRDDTGIVALEYLVLGTVAGMGVTVGLAATSTAINTELVELGNAVLTLDQSYQFSGLQVHSAGGGVIARRAGSGATDSYHGNTLSATPPVVHNINVTP